MQRARRLRLLVLAQAGVLLLGPTASPPAWAVTNVPPSPPSIIREVRVKEPLLALTFDDGPNSQYTPQVLDLLRQHHAHATFFVSGSQAEKFPGLLSREVAEGHQIGNHAFHHIDLRPLAPEQLRQEVDRAADLIRAHTGQTPTVFRPPLGNFEPETIAILQEMGYKFVLWTWATNSEDSLRHPRAQKIINKIIGGAKPGAIILLHDHGGDRKQTIAALATVLERLTTDGYRFVTLDELLQPR